MAFSTSAIRDRCASTISHRSGADEYNRAQPEIGQNAFNPVKLELQQRGHRAARYARETVRPISI
jgi:hypothetical protein